MNDQSTRANSNIRQRNALALMILNHSKIVFYVKTFEYDNKLKFETLNRLLTRANFELDITLDSLKLDRFSEFFEHNKNQQHPKRYLEYSPSNIIFVNEK